MDSRAELRPAHKAGSDGSFRLCTVCHLLSVAIEVLVLFCLLRVSCVAVKKGHDGAQDPCTQSAVAINR